MFSQEKIHTKLLQWLSRKMWDHKTKLMRTLRNNRIGILSFWKNVYAIEKMNTIFSVNILKTWIDIKYNNAEYKYKRQRWYTPKITKTLMIQSIEKIIVMEYKHISYTYNKVCLNNWHMQIINSLWNMHILEIFMFKVYYVLCLINLT